LKISVLPQNFQKYRNKRIWAKEHCYTKQNPFDNITTKPKHKKTRQKIAEYLKKQDNIGGSIIY
jgi:hypothetical protein